MNIKDTAKKILDALSNVEHPDLYVGVIEKELWESLREPLNLFYTLRLAQNSYFHMRTEGNLKNAKKMETKVDALIADLREQRAPEKQKNLFPNKQ